jgi:hypothetical protein
MIVGIVAAVLSIIVMVVGKDGRGTVVSRVDSTY